MKKKKKKKYIGFEISQELADKLDARIAKNKQKDPFENLSRFLRRLIENAV